MKFDVIEMLNHTRPPPFDHLVIHFLTNCDLSLSSITYYGLKSRRNNQDCQV